MIRLLIATASAPISCTTQLQIRTLHKEHPSIGVMMQEEQLARMEKPVVRDTVREESDVMNAVLDENGEMKPIDVLDAAFVVARHKQVSERHGTVELDFEIVVPEIMLNTAWQVRITPVLTILNDKEQLDSILISGKDYKRRQQNGYEKYEKYLKSLLPLNEEELFLYRRSLKLFLERYAAAPFGVTEEEAVKHYTKNWLKRLNLIRHSRVGKKYERFVKSPYINGGVRIDTIIDKSEGNIHYRYRQLINTTPKMRRIDMNLRSSIETDGSILYSNLSKDTTKFYISSISSLADNREKYIGTDDQWNEAQGIMAKILDHLGIDYKIGIDEAAFYGPKLDIQIKNVYGKEDTLITIQIDQMLAEKLRQRPAGKRAVVDDALALFVAGEFPAFGDVACPRLSVSFRQFAAAPYIGFEDGTQFHRIYIHFFLPKTSVILVPLPTSLSSFILAPYASASCLTMASPSPVLSDLLRVRAVSILKNLSNTLSRYSGAMPTPVSSTLNETAFSV